MSYSYSSMSTFNTCPRQYYHKYIAKDAVYESSEAAEYGSEMHNFIDKNMRGEQDFTPRYEFLRPVVNSIKSIDGEKYTEYGIGFNEDWSETTFEDRGAFIKGKLDFLAFHPTAPRAKILDWKFSGKPNASNYKLEMDMFVMLTMKKHKEIEQIRTGLVWLKTPAPTSWKDYTRDELPVVELGIMQTIGRIEDAISFERFPCKPSGLCYGWCNARLCDKWKPKKEKR